MINYNYSVFYLKFINKTKYSYFNVYIIGFNQFNKTGKQFSILYPWNCNVHIFNLSKIQIFFSAQKILTQLLTVQSYLFFVTFANAI